MSRTKKQDLKVSMYAIWKDTGVSYSRIQAYFNGKNVHLDTAEKIEESVKKLTNKGNSELYAEMAKKA